MTTKILKAIEEFESARAKASPGYYSEDFNDTLLIDTSDEQHFGYEMCKVDRDFITEAANKATLFTQALKIAVKALEQYSDDNKTPASTDALKEIERILECKEK